MILDTENYGNSKDNGQRKENLEQHEVRVAPVMTGRQFGVLKRVIVDRNPGPVVVAELL